MSAAAAPWSGNNQSHYQNQQRGTPSSSQGVGSRLPSKRPRSLTPRHASRGELWQHHPLDSSPDHSHRPRSPTLAFKRLRVSGGDNDNAAFLFPTAVQERRTWHVEDAADEENYNGSRKRPADALSYEPRLRPNAPGEERGTYSNPPVDDCNYKPVNHLLGELHRQRRLRHPASGSDAAGSVEIEPVERPDSCDMSFEYQSTPPPPPHASRRHVVQLRTDTKLI